MNTTTTSASSVAARSSTYSDNSTLQYSFFGEYSPFITHCYRIHHPLLLQRIEHVPRKWHQESRRTILPSIDLQQDSLSSYFTSIKHCRVLSSPITAAKQHYTKVPACLDGLYYKPSSCTCLWRTCFGRIDWMIARNIWIQVFVRSVRDDRNHWSHVSWDPGFGG